MPQPTTVRADPLRDPIYLAVGRCLEKWSWVEANLAILLSQLMYGRRNSRLIGPAFHAVVNFNSKLEMVDAVAQRTLTGKRLARWNTLRDRIKRKSSKRNEIAHFSIVMHGARNLQARLHPYWGIMTDTPAPRGDGLTADQIEERAQSFNDLGTEILAFYQALPTQKARR